MAEGKKLTKREKKAASFRQKQKGKTIDDEENAVPESDVLHDQATTTTDQTTSSNSSSTTTISNKRKANADDKPATGTKIDVPGTSSTEDGPTKKKTRRGKKKPVDGVRYIVFVGNLSYATTKEDLEKHFASAGGIVSARLLTDKVTKKPKGFAFIEFEDSRNLNKALAFHHTSLNKRQINVELTAGGGGKSTTRAEKLKVKNERLQEERQKAHQDKVHGKIPDVKSSSYGGTKASAEEEF
ncbi:hypothetical protein BCR42DRAFT_403814 [Absidia repens]|uniref:RRM domain-containing protein n=1 Tax=Absidia repens TaxID=90262 RepID=A0A1X2IVG7_9FUNG|nr:hypothetical protein BCR42DRAFT_403814 [Absidia repens]